MAKSHSNLWKLAHTGPMTIDPTQHASNQDTFQNQWSRFGTYPNQIKNALERQGLSVIAEATTPGLKINLITQSTPAIVLVGWMVNNRGVLTRNGGHFIVAVNVNSRNQIVFLDPGDGTLLESGNNGRHQSNGRMEFSLYISKA